MPVRLNPLTNTTAATAATPARIGPDTVAARFAAAHIDDGYATRGVVLPRDAAHRVIAALQRDGDEMRRRGGTPNLAGAEENFALAQAIGLALTADHDRNPTTTTEA